MMGRLSGKTQDVKTASGISPIAIAGEVTVYTPHFVLRGGDAFGINVLAASSGTVDLLVQLEQSESVPTLEASDVESVIPEGFANIINLTDKLVHIKQVTPIPQTYGRLKITGQSGNDASTTIRIKMFIQE